MPEEASVDATEGPADDRDGARAARDGDRDDGGWDDGGWDEDGEEGPEDVLTDADDLEDRAGSVVAGREAGGLVLRWRARGSAAVTEMLRFDPRAGLLRVFPLTLRVGEFVPQFDRLRELHVEAPGWPPGSHSAESERFGLLRAEGLPKGFDAVYAFGLGIMRDYRGLLHEIEDRTACTTIRFVLSGPEGADGDVFRVALGRFADYRAAVDRNRQRGGVAVRRVNAAERHNAVADLFGLDPVRPVYGRNPVIRAMTEEAATGQVVDADDRAALVDLVSAEARAAADEAPERFGRLRHDLELVSLDVLIGQFERGLTGRAARDERHWQRFFTENAFALQQVFSAPLLVLRPLAHVKGAEFDGSGSRIADFLCVNAVTRSAVVIEIKTPGTPLMAAKGYRGSGTAEVHPPARELGGAIAQVQAQMESVSRDLKDHPALGSIDRWHVRGAVIAGTVAALGDEQRESFLRLRDGLNAVEVLGFDEVGKRLRMLHALLNAPPPAAAP